MKKKITGDDILGFEELIRQMTEHSSPAAATTYIICVTTTNRTGDNVYKVSLTNAGAVIGGIGGIPTPEVRTNNTLLATTIANDNLDLLDSAIGSDAQLGAVAVRTNNPITVDSTVMSKLGLLDDAIGADNVAIVRTNNPTVVASTILAKIQALDSAIGADLVPVVRTNNPTISNTTVVVKIAALDAAVGVTPTSTNYVSGASSVNVNLSTIDTQLGNLLASGAFGVNATGTLDSAAVASDIIFEAVTSGVSGNSITVTTANGAGLAIGVVGTDITVTLNSGVTVSNDVVAAINADATAKLLVFATPEGAGTGIVDDGVNITLSAGTNALSYDTDESTNHLTAAKFAAAGYAENLKNADKLLDAEFGAPVTPVARTNNPTIGTNDINTNISELDNAIGGDLTPVVRVNNPTVSDTTVVAKIAVLDAAVGVTNTPIVRTNNPTLTSNSVNLNIDALDAAIGVTPTSTNYIGVANSVNVNLTEVDSQLNNIQDAGKFGVNAYVVTGVAGGNPGIIGLEAVVAGTSGNSITCVAANGVGLVISVIGSAITATLNSGVTTAAEVAAAINVHAAAKLLVFATESTPGIIGDFTIVSLTSGTDALSYDTDESTNALTTANFTALGYSENLKSADKILDGRIGPDTTPTARTTGALIAASSVNVNLNGLDAAIGLDVTPTVRTVGPTVAANSSNANLDALNAAIGVDASMTPLTRTAGLVTVASDIYTNIGNLDDAIGADATITPVVRTTGPVVAANNVFSNLDALDAAIGADSVPSIRTVGPTVAANATNANVDALDTAIGTDAQLTAVVRTTTPVAVGNSVNTNIDALDASIGADVTVTTRTVGPLIAANVVNANINALDTAIGTDAQLVPVVTRTTGAVANANSVNQNLDAIDTYLGNDVVPTVRTAGALVAANDIGSNLEALNAAIGIDASITPVVRTTGPVVAANDVFTNIDLLDSAIGADCVPTVRSVGPLVAANAVGANLTALDAAIGTDAELTAVARTAGLIANGQSVQSNIDALDTAIGPDVTSTTYTVAASAVNANISTLDTQLNNVRQAGKFGVNASGTLDSVPANADVELEAIVAGVSGNSITCTTANGAGLVVGVVGSDITVTLDSGVSTSVDVVAALNADADAKLLVFAVVEGTGLGLVDDAKSVTLTSGTDALSYDTDESTNFLTTANFTALGYAENLKNADKILDSHIGKNGTLSVRTKKYTIGVPAVTGCDYYFSSVENKLIQEIEMGTNLIPALGRVTDIIVNCTESVTGSVGDETGFNIDVGNVADGAQYCTAASCDDATDLVFTPSAGAFVLDPVAVVSSVFLSGTPTINDWDELTAGKWDIYITYNDLSNL